MKRNLSLKESEEIEHLLEWSYDMDQRKCHWNGKHTFEGH
ncbi:MAG: hypothetical protein MW690_001013 [Methanophagales archaeon]|nr:hypothetical protein [Methanophagales archaeon]